MAFLGLAMLAMLVALALPKDIAARSRNSRLCYKSSCNLADLWGCCTVGLAANPRNGNLGTHNNEIHENRNGKIS